MQTNIKIADTAQGAFLKDPAMLVGAENCVQAFLKDPALQGVTPTIRTFRTQRFGRNHLCHRNWEHICIPEELGTLSGEKSYYGTLQYVSNHMIDPQNLLDGKMASFPDLWLFETARFAFDDGWGESYVICTCVKNGNEADFFFLRILPPKGIKAADVVRGFDVSLHAMVSMNDVQNAREGGFFGEQIWEELIDELRMLGMEFYERTLRKYDIDPHLVTVLRKEASLSGRAKVLECSIPDPKGSTPVLLAVSVTEKENGTTCFRYRLQKEKISVEYRVNSAQFGDVEMIDYFGCLEDFRHLHNGARSGFSENEVKQLLSLWELRTPGLSPGVFFV